MYTNDQLSRYPYFAELLADNRLEALLDPLTGIVARQYILGFAQSLIAEGIPFSFYMLDLDNFKFINDTYGHHVGDEVLVRVSESFAAFTDGIGVVGRFGGDEIIIVNLRDTGYDEEKRFMGQAYAGGTVLRQNIVLENCRPFITGTVGCAAFPKDAKDYDELFSMIDKTLYRGKTKGRNCYIIYMEEKHRNIEIRHIARHGVYTSMHRLIRLFELVPGLLNKLNCVLPLLMKEIQITELYYVGRRGRLRSVRNPALDEDASDIEALMVDDVFTANSLEQVKRKSPIFYAALKKLETEALLVVCVGMDMEEDGYLICAEPRSKRIWQEDECAIMYFLAKLIATRIRLNGERLDG